MLYLVIQLLLLSYMLHAFIKMIDSFLEANFPNVNKKIKKFFRTLPAYLILLVGPFLISLAGEAIFVGDAETAEVRSGIFAVAASISVAAFFEVKRMRREDKLERKKNAEKFEERKAFFESMCIVLKLMIKRLSGQIDSMKNSIQTIENAQKNGIAHLGYLPFPQEDISIAQLGEVTLETTIRYFRSEHFETFSSALIDYRIAQEVLVYWKEQITVKSRANKPINDIKHELVLCLEKLEITMKSVKCSHKIISEANQLTNEIDDSKVDE